jgi:KaiC/GvpD/RAD55 family RecA-like ATPase
LKRHGEPLPISLQMDEIIYVIRCRSKKPGVEAEQFGEPYRSAWEAVASAAFMDEDVFAALAHVLGGEPNGKAILGEIMSRLPESAPEFFTLAKLAETLTPVEFLWRRWIPRGMLSALVAAPGAGKSYVALDLCHRITAGMPFPDGAPVQKPGANVIYVDAELIPQLINERAKAWGMDREKIYLMMPSQDDVIDFNATVYRKALQAMVEKLEPELVVIDSLSSVQLKGENNVEDVRALLAFFGALAFDYNIGVLLVHHLRKQGTRIGNMADLVTADDVRGSGHIVAMSRSMIGLSVVQVGADPDRNGPRRLEVIKTNLCAYPSPLGVKLESVSETVARVTYLGEPPRQYELPSESDLCADWIVERLQDGPMRPKDVVELAEQEGFSQRVVYIARDKLEGQVVNTKGKRHPQNEWQLA